MKKRVLLRAAAGLLASAVCCAAMPAFTSAATFATLEECLRNAWENHSATASVSSYGLSVSEFAEAYYRTLYTDAKWFYVDTSYSYSTVAGKVATVKIDYCFDKSDSERMKQEMDAEVASLVSQCAADWTDAEKVLFFHDHLASVCSYDLSYQIYDAYSAMLGGSAVCQGYALAMCVICRAAGIPCYALASTELNHMWNVVQVGGKWYHVDVTDDDISPNMLGQAAHTFLLCSDAVMQASSHHSASDWKIFADEASPITCTSEAYADAFWHVAIDAVTPLEDGSFLLAIQSDPAAVTSSKNIHATLSRCRLGAEPISVYQYSTYWKTPTNAVYTNCYSYAEIWGGRIYYTTPTAICSVSADGSDPQTFYTLTAAEKAYGYLYGMQIGSDGVMTYQLMASPAFASEEDLTINAEYHTIQMPALSAETEPSETTETTVTTTAETTESSAETTTTVPETESTAAETTTTTTPEPATAATTTTTTTEAVVTTTTPEPIVTTTTTIPPEPEDTTASSSGQSHTKPTSAEEETATETTTTTSAVTEPETTAAEPETTLASETTTTTAFVLLGDVDEDDDVTLKDAVLLAQAVGNVEGVVLSAKARRSADLNGDGSIDNRDLTWLLRDLAGLSNR